MTDEFLTWLMDLFSTSGEIRARRMFGGHGLYRDELMFALIADGGLFLKIDDQTRARFEAAGSAPFVYSRGRRDIAMSYWSAPDAALESPQEMQPWVELAVGAARRAVRRPSKPRKRRAAGVHRTDA